MGDHQKSLVTQRGAFERRGRGEANMLDAAPWSDLAQPSTCSQHQSLGGTNVHAPFTQAITRSTLTHASGARGGQVAQLLAAYSSSAETTFICAETLSPMFSPQPLALQSLVSFTATQSLSILHERFCAICVWENSW